MLSKLFHATHGTAFTFSESLGFGHGAAEVKNKIIRGAIGIFRGTPEISVAANTVELSVQVLVASRERLEPESIGAVPFFEPATSRFKSDARAADAFGSRTVRDLDERFKIFAGREAPPFGANALSLDPCVKAAHLFAIAFRAIGAIGAIGTIHTGQYKIQVLRHPRLRTYLHDAVTLTVAHIREGFRTGGKQEQ